MKITKNSYFTFSGGEVHCSNVSSIETSPIILLDYTMNGLMALAQYSQVWKQNLDPRLRIHNLILPYVPYARQDRWMNTGEPFSLKLYCDMLNLLNFNNVTIYDPHSDVAPALINNCRIIPQWELAGRVIPKEYLINQNSLFISPDAGAYKKLSKLITNDTFIAVGVKHRDPVEGKITHTDVFSPTSIEGRDCIIVDDICDGGRTFIELAKVLRAKGAQKVILYVTHGIFSAGFLELYKHIDHIYTTNSFPWESNDRLTVLKIV